MDKFTVLLLGVVCLGSQPARADSSSGDAAFVNGDYATAYQEWRAEADAGDASAMCGLGTLYDTGHGVTQDFGQALTWYRRAAEAGSAPAMLATAAMYDNGRGTPVDRPEAVRWYRKAAEHGMGRAAYDLGVIYRDGDGVARDPMMAAKYFQMAATDGLAAARTQLASLGAPADAHAEADAAADGRGDARPSVQAFVSLDTIAAVSRFQEAALAGAAPAPDALKAFHTLLPKVSEQAASGNHLAQFDLGFACEHGAGRPADLVRAYVYYLRAASAPDDSIRGPALKGVLAVSRRLTPEQHAQARSMLLADTP